MKFSLCAFVLTLAAASSVFAGALRPDKTMLDSKVAELATEGFECVETKRGKYENDQYKTALSCQKSTGESKLFVVLYQDVGPEGSKCSSWAVTRIDEI